MSEREIRQLLSDGWTPEEVAKRLCVRLAEVQAYAATPKEPEPRLLE